QQPAIETRRESKKKKQKSCCQAGVTIRRYVPTKQTSARKYEIGEYYFADNHIARHGGGRSCATRRRLQPRPQRRPAVVALSAGPVVGFGPHRGPCGLCRFPLDRPTCGESTCKHALATYVTSIQDG